nr:VaFE repeat-containing surface-anchored protein [Actinomycetales bacterium]
MRWRGRLKGALAVAGGTALLAMGAVVPSSAPAAADAGKTFNPFVANAPDGQTATFGVLARGDLVLRNGHNQSTFAAFGEFSNTHPATGSGKMFSEAVPLIDGTETRLLAGKFTDKSDDSSHMDITDHFVKFSDVSNLDLVQTSPAKVQVGSSTLAVNNLQNGSLADITAKNAVPSYFSGLDAKVDATNKCLAGMYADANKLKYDNDIGFKSGVVNYFDYADIAGQTLWANYRPAGHAADSPIVIKVAKTDGISIEDPMQFLDGDSKLTAFVLWDLSEVTGAVTFEKFYGGAVYAPNADLTFNMNASINTQIIGKNTEFFEIAQWPGQIHEIHQINFAGILPCVTTADPDPEPEPKDPKIGTTAKVDGSDDNVLSIEGGTVVDTVAFENLTVGTDYVLKGVLYNATDKVLTGITASKAFKAFKAETVDGEVDVVFTLTEEQATEFAGKTLVVFEYLELADGTKVAEHADPKSESQTFTVEEKPEPVLDPKIGTTVAVDGKANKVLPLTGGKVIDTVAYKDLTVGTEYTLDGELMLITGDDVSATGIKGSATFTPVEANGTTTVTFDISAEQVADYAGKDLVVFEYLFDGDKKVTEHADPKDPAQTFTVEKLKPSIGTTAKVEGSNDNILSLEGGTIVDTVAYKNLTPGIKYTLTGVIYDAESGDSTGITSEKTPFTPTEANGATEVTFTITAEQADKYAGKKLVVFEYLTLGEIEVANHADLKDDAQSFVVDEKPEPQPEPSIGTTVSVTGSDAKVLPLTGGEVIDTVKFENLTPGTTYTLKGEVRTAPAGETTGITAYAKFLAKEANGYAFVTFTISADDVAAYAGQDLVVYEYLYLEGELAADHTDPTDEAQSFVVEEKPVTPEPGPAPKIGTTAKVEGSDDNILSLEGGTVIDTVAYENLTPGTEYILTGVLFDASTGESTGIESEATFTADKADGTTEVTFTITAAQAEKYAGKKLVVFEYLYLDGEKVAEHADIEDKAQSFVVDEKPVTPEPQPEPETGSATWTKVDQQGKQLAGSVWTLTGPGAYAKGVEVTDCVATDAAACTGADKDPAAGKFLIEELPLGDYTLVEKVAPKGYVLNATPVKFTIDEDNAEKAHSAGSIVNVAEKPELPATGSSAQTLLALAGAALALIAGGLGLQTVRRNRA